MIADLLSRGFLPQELPPPFTSSSLRNIVSRRGALHQQVQLNQTSKCVEHNLARTGSLRRRLSIPNPVAYSLLSQVLSQNIANCHSIYAKSKISKSTPVAGVDRAVTRASQMHDLPIIRAVQRSGARYVFKTDISRCYPSIYTHSIPWAIHSKIFAKANRGLQHWGNVVDKCVRDCQDQQTIGIPIGPDASFLIAEIILSDIDEKIQKRFPNARGFRYVDDYEFVFSSIGEGEEFLGGMQSVLNEYELVMNPGKTKIEELPIPVNAIWASELQVFSIRNAGRGQASDCIRCFDRAFELSRAYVDENVLKYAVSRIKSVVFDQTNWPLVEGFILQIIAIEPGAIALCLRTLMQYKIAGYTIDKSRLAYVLNQVLRRNLPLGHGSEIAWAIWGCIEFGLTIDSDCAQQCIDMNDSVVLMVITDAFTRNFIHGAQGLNWSSASGKISTAELYQENWLYCYEVDRHNWFRTNGSIISSDPTFKFLNSKHVEFYDVNAKMSVTTSSAVGTSGASPD